LKTDLQFVNCNICGNNNTETVAIQNGFNVVRCRSCSLVYVNPRPSSEALIEMYNTYHSRDSKAPESWSYLMKKNFMHASEILQKAFPLPPHPPLGKSIRLATEGGREGGERRLLDIGCGYGYFLEIMRENGWDVSGVDPSANTLKIAGKKGLNVMQGTIERINYPENSFDAVTMFYVLEHLPDPYDALKKILMMLKPRGMLILRIPHTTPIVKFLSLLGIKNNLYDAPFHLYDFSPETMTSLLKKAGFSSIKIMPGRPTLPPKFSERIASLLSTNLTRILFALSLGNFLLPGVSKTVIANKL